MVCKQYSERLTAGAFGGLTARQHADLMAHLRGCDACQEAYERAREVSALVDRTVITLVEGTPSRGFVARLRERLAAEAEPARPAWRARIATAGALAAIGVLLAYRFVPVEPAPAIAWRIEAPAAPRIESSQPLESSKSARGMPRRPPDAPKERTNAIVRVLVEPNQVAAVEEFARVMTASGENASQILSAQQRVGEPLEIRTLDIPPLRAAGGDSADAGNDSGSL